MFPALPTGMARASGGRPSTSQTSKGRRLLTLDTIRVHGVHQGDIAQSPPTARIESFNAASKLPAIWMISAP